MTRIRCQIWQQGRRRTLLARLAIAPLHDLGEDTERDLSRAHSAKIETSRILHASESLVRYAGLADVLDQMPRLLPARDEPDVRGVARRRCRQRLLVARAHRSDDDPRRRIRTDERLANVRRNAN